MSSSKVYLDNFSHSIGKFALRQSFQEGGIDEDILGLPEGANQVLSVWGVNCGFSTDARVDHGQ